MKIIDTKKVVDEIYAFIFPTVGILTVVYLGLLFKNHYIKELIIVKAFLTIWLSCTIAAWGVKKFEHKFYACLFFIIFSMLYLVLFPLIAVVADAHFVIHDNEMGGYLHLFDLATIAIIIFTALYCGILSNVRTKTYSNVNYNVSPPVFYTCALMLMGAAAALWLTQTASIAEIYGYEDVAPVFTGKGWVLRVSEMLAVSGLLFMTYSKRRWDMFFSIGVLLILAFTVFRVQFLNRENVIKYGLVTIIYFMYVKKSHLKNKELIFIGASLTALLLVIPYFAIFRAQLTNQSTTINYWDTFSRDLNFAEVAAVMFEHENMKGVVGLGAGLKNIFGQLFPRILFEDKPLSLGVQITAITTLVPLYNENAPVYSYAPTIFGSFYYVSGSWMSMAYISILAAASAVVSRWAHDETRPAVKKIKAVTLAIFIYHIIISSIKLEPGNALPAAIIPCMSAYLASVNFMLKKHK